MREGIQRVAMYEWDSKGAHNCPGLQSTPIDQTPSTLHLIAKINKAGQLRLTERQHRWHIESNHYVGRVRVGSLEITILPKIRGESLLRLMQYAYDFRKITPYTDTDQVTGPCGFEDLLILQLVSEAQEILSRGLSRAYVLRQERLASPRGRFDVNRLAREGDAVAATMPCQHHPRIEDTLLNRVLLSGLHLAASIATTVDLRRECRRLASLMDEQVTAVWLDRSIAKQAMWKLSRLTDIYRPSLSIIQMLVNAQAVVLHDEEGTATVPGLLFDMNAFFQALVSRLLRENLPDHTIEDQHRLREMFRYNVSHNPLKRSNPTPRPDFAITQGGKVRAILDAKYRDLYDRELPASILYQLVVYAISQPELLRSIIVYPTMNPDAKEARIDVCDPLTADHRGQVCLRPLILPELELLLADETHQGTQRRHDFTNRLALGL